MAGPNGNVFAWDTRRLGLMDLNHGVWGSQLAAMVPHFADHITRTAGLGHEKRKGKKGS